jgi:hypothetical protein
MSDSPHPSVKRLILEPISAASRHPLAGVVLGFLMTGVVGTTLTNHYAALRQNEAEVSQLRESRRKAVLDLSRLFAERFTRAEMLEAALERHPTPAVVDRLRQLYDDAEIKWGLGGQGALLLAREVLGENFHLFQQAFEARMGKAPMAKIHDALIQASDAAMAGNDPGPILQETKLRQLLTELRPASDAVFATLYDMSAVSQMDPADPKAIAARDRALKEIKGGDQ